MQITIEELRELAVFVKQHMLDRSTKYDHDVFEVVRKENQELMSMISFVKTHYPEAIEAWQAVKKIGE
jgi:hypothetical protein